MPSGANLTSLDGAMKTYYTDTKIENMTYKDHPLYALMPKREDFYGRSAPVDIVYANPQARNQSFAVAQAASLTAAPKVKFFNLTRVHDYAVATLDNEAMKASKNDKGAFFDLSTLTMDTSLDQLGASIGQAAYRSGYGEQANIGSISGATITLANIADIVNFDQGMNLDLGATMTGAVRAYGTSTNPLIITGVDRANGILTFGYNVTDATNGIPTAAANDFIFIAGDHVSGLVTRLSGLAAWLPVTTPVGGDNFFGVDRSVDTRLGGLRYANTGGAGIEETLQKGAALVNREGGAIDHYFMNYDAWENLILSLGSKVQYIDLQANADVGFRGVVINSSRGPIKVVADQSCPAGIAYGLKLSSWCFWSLEKVGAIDTDGLQMLRQSTSDGVECRWGYYANIRTNAPGHNIVVTL